MNICKMGRFWVQTYHPTLNIVLNFNIPRNPITDSGNKVPSVNEMGTNIMYNRQRERERERERDGYKCTTWRRAKKFVTANIIIQTKFIICYMIRKYTSRTGTEISGLASLILGWTKFTDFDLNRFSVNLASIQIQKITSKLKYAVELTKKKPLQFFYEFKWKDKEMQKKKWKQNMSICAPFSFRWQRGLNDTALQQICVTPLQHLEAVGLSILVGGGEGIVFHLPQPL